MSKSKSRCDCGNGATYPVRINGERRLACMPCLAVARSQGKTVVHESRVAA